MRYPIPPIVGVQVYRRDVVIVRRQGKGQPEKPDRGSITEFSKRSRQRLAFVACNTDIVFKTMITLTYPGEYSQDGERVKADLHAFLEWMRRELKATPGYLWFLEFQARGAPHYHVLIDWAMPRSRVEVKAFRFRLAAAWYRIVGSGDPRHLAAGTRVERVRKPDGAARYAVKYALKMRQKQVPEPYQNVGRFWGCSRDVVPSPVQSHRVTEDDVRGALEGWPYAPGQDRPVYRVLYGVSDRFLRDVESPADPQE